MSDIYMRCSVVVLDCGVLVYVGVRELRFFFFQAEDGIRDLVRSRGLGDVYKRQATTLRLIVTTCMGAALMLIVVRVAG